VRKEGKEGRKGKGRRGEGREGKGGPYYMSRITFQYVPPPLVMCRLFRHLMFTVTVYSYELLYEFHYKQ